MHTWETITLNVIMSIDSSGEAPPEADPKRMSSFLVLLVRLTFRKFYAGFNREVT